MKLEEGTILTTDDLAEFFKVGKTTMKKTEKRKQYIERLHDYCDFTEERGRCNKLLYKIHKVYDREEPEKPSVYRKNLEIYKKKSKEIVEKNPIMTYAGIQKRIENDEEIKQLHHKPFTQQNYISVGMKEMFGREVKRGGTDGAIIRKLWCKMEKDCFGIQDYIPMTNEEIDYFFQLKTEDKKISAFEKDRWQKYGDYKNGLLTKAEYLKIREEIDDNTYLARCERFQLKYAGWPLYVPEYIAGKRFNPETMEWSEIPSK